MAQKKKNKARGRNSTRRDDHQNKARPAKVMALSARDAVKRLPLATAKKKSGSNLHIKAEHARTPTLRKLSVPFKKAMTSGPQGTVEPTSIIAPENTSPSMFESQMQVFATLLKWSPLAMVIRQHALVTDMMFNVHFPKKSI